MVYRRRMTFFRNGGAVTIVLWFLCAVIVKSQTNLPSSEPSAIQPSSKPSNNLPSSEPSAIQPSSKPSTIPILVFSSSIKFYYDASSTLYQSLAVQDIVNTTTQAVSNYVALKIFGCVNYPSVPCSGMSAFALSSAGSSVGDAPPTSAPTVFDATTYLPAVALHDQYYFNGSAYYALPTGLGTSLYSYIIDRRCNHTIPRRIGLSANTHFLAFCVTHAHSSLYLSTPLFDTRYVAYARQPAHGKQQPIFEI